MTSLELTRDVTRAIVRDISALDGLLPSWVADFRQGVLPAGMVFNRASGGTYVNASGVVTAATTDTPRFDRQPVTLKPLGLLLEDARTNYVLNSLTPATQSVALAVGTYTLWVTGTGSCALTAGTAVGTGFGTATAAAPVVFTLTTAGSMTCTVAGSVTAFQLENGDYPTSQIVTTTAAATRAKDVAYLPASWFTTAGTLLVEYIYGRDNIRNGCKVLELGSSQNDGLQLGGYTGSGVLRGQIVVGGTVQGQMNFVQAAAGTFYKTALAFTPTELAGTTNGAAVQSVALASFPAISNLYLSRYGATNLLNGCVGKVAFYPQRLSNDQLLKLTS